MWHYVVPPQGLPVKISGELCSLESFKEQLQKIKEIFNVISMGKAIESIRQGVELLPNTFVLTFDDGTKDHYKIVLPILQELGLTATFFVMKAPLAGKIPSTLKLQLIVGEANPRAVRGEVFPWVMRNNNLGEHFQNIEVPPEHYRFEIEAIREIKWICNFKLGPKDKDKVVDEMFRMVLGDRESEFVKKMFMGKSEIIALSKAGMEIGSHSVGHYVMSSLEDKDLENEVVDSKRFLERLLGHPISYFAYPSAGAGTVGVREAVEHVGYLAAFEYDPRVKINQPPYDLFGLKRIHEKDLEKEFLI